MSAALLRLQIERSLEHRFPAALSPAPRALETTSTGICAVDGLLGGGLPAGAITEIAGAQSSGRTSLALAFLARQTGEGRACAWVDGGDAFDPESAAASGIVLRRLLWVRCGGDGGAAEKRGAPGGFAEKHPSGAKARADFAGAKRGLKPPPPSEGLFSAGAEARSFIDWLSGPAEAVPLLQDIPNSSFSEGAETCVDFAAFSAIQRGVKTTPRSEEIFSAAGEARVDFAAMRRGVKTTPRSEQSVSAVFEERGRKKPWPRLEQAIRSTDLLLQAGGFAAIVLDLAGTAPEHASRIPLATWFRFRQAAARTRCSLVVLGQAACAQSSATAVLECAPLVARDKGMAGGGTVLDGFTYRLRRSRGDVGFRSAAGAGRKPPESAWQADCAWNTEKRA